MLAVILYIKHFLHSKSTHYEPDIHCLLNLDLLTSNPPVLIFVWTLIEVCLSFEFAFGKLHCH